MPVHAEKIHGRQIRQDQVGFASARVLLREGECGKQQEQEGRHGFVLTLQKCLRASPDGHGKPLHRRSPLVRADDLARKEEGRDEREYAHGHEKQHPILYSHKFPH